MNLIIGRVEILSTNPAWLVEKNHIVVSIFASKLRHLVYFVEFIYWLIVYACLSKLKKLGTPYTWLIIPIDMQIDCY